MKAAKRRAQALVAATSGDSGSSDGAGNHRFFERRAVDVLTAYLLAAAPVRTRRSRSSWPGARTTPTPKPPTSSATIPAWPPCAAPCNKPRPWSRRPGPGSGRPSATPSAASPTPTSPTPPSPTPNRPGFDPDAFIRAGGTLYVVGSDDDAAAQAPLVTAFVQHVLDTARRLALTDSADDRAGTAHPAVHRRPRRGRLHLPPPRPARHPVRLRRPRGLHPLRPAVPRPSPAPVGQSRRHAVRQHHRPHHPRRPQIRRHPEMGVPARRPTPRGTPQPADRPRARPSRQSPDRARTGRHPRTRRRPPDPPRPRPPHRPRHARPHRHPQPRLETTRLATAPSRRHPAPPAASHERARTTQHGTRRPGHGTPAHVSEVLR